MENKFEIVWANCLNIIKDNISHEKFKTWFEPILPVKLEENMLTIQVPSQFFYEWLEENFVDLLKSTIKKELGNKGRLEYSVVMDNSYYNNMPYTVKFPASNKKLIRNSPISMPLDINKSSGVSIPNPFIIPGLKKVQVPSQLIENYSFENFIEGDCNRLARSAGLAVANNPGKTSFNPLLIYSNVGLGKTHLANAIGIQIKNNFPEKTVLFVSSEQFLSQYISSIRNDSMNDFVHFYQMIDALIIDDIQFFAKKEKTQDVFFQIFNQLHQNGKQIVITSDKAPVDMEGIIPRLLSRFKWGLSADIQTPDLETRIAILQKKLYKDGVEMPEDVIEYIAYSITTNIRELEGALISMLAQASLNRKEINLELAKHIIDKFVTSTSREISIDYIQKVICDYFSVPLNAINSKSRKREIVQARQLAMFFSKKLTKTSLATIGLHCGNKDHATVLHSCKTINNLIETDKQFKVYVEELEKKIKL